MGIHNTRRGALQWVAAGAAGAVLMAMGGTAAAADFPAPQQSRYPPGEPQEPTSRRSDGTVS